MAKNKPLKQQVPDIRTALDMALAEHLAVTQGKLAKANPKDTGRMASSWYITQSTPSTEVRPDGWAAPKAAKVDIPTYTGKVEFFGTWYITNNLPYAYRVCFDPIWAKGSDGGTNWYRDISTQQPADLDKTITKFLRRVG